MDSDTKITLMLEELKNICRDIDDKFENVEQRFEKIDERFDKLENRFDNLENRFDNLENRFDNLENRFDNLEKRFDKFEEKNEAEHKTMYNMISSLNSAFLSFETQNSLRISNLEHHIFNQN